MSLLLLIWWMNRVGVKFTTGDSLEIICTSLSVLNKYSLIRWCIFLKILLCTAI